MIIFVKIEEFVSVASKTTFEIILIYSFSEPINLSSNSERWNILTCNQNVDKLFVQDYKLMDFVGLIVLLLLHLSMEMKNHYRSNVLNHENPFVFEQKRN